MATGAEFCTAVLTGLGRVAAVACAACSGIDGSKAASEKTAAMLRMQMFQP
jgi:TRAP-type C4-dicarboxylate transport system permease large subunit